MLSIKKIFNFSIFYKPIKSKVLIYDAYSTRFAKKLFKKTKFSIFHTRYDAISLYILFLTIFKSGLKDFFKNYKKNFFYLLIQKSFILLLTTILAFIN